jgi:hypothetical protein
MSFSSSFADLELSLKRSLAAALEEEKVPEDVIDRVLKKLFAKEQNGPVAMSPGKEEKLNAEAEEKKDRNKSHRQSGLFGY